MRCCSRVGQYIECTSKIILRKQMIKLYYMQYGIVALYLSFVCVNAEFHFPYNKGIVQEVSTTKQIPIHDMVPPTDVS